MYLNFVALNVLHNLCVIYVYIMTNKALNVEIVLSFYCVIELVFFCSRSSKEQLEPNGNDQTPNNKSESHYKMFPLKVMEDKNLDKKEDGLKSDVNLDKKEKCLENYNKQIEESTLDNKINESLICQKNSSNSSMPSVSDKCKSIDNSKEFGNFLRFIVNKLGDKLNESDNNISPAEIAKQLFNENPAVYKSISNNINLDSNDLNHVKQAIASLNFSNGSESLPTRVPSQIVLGSSLNENLTKLDVRPKNTVKNYALSKLSSEEPPKHAFDLAPSKLTKVSERCTVHTTITSDKPVQKVVSSLKPGTLRDLENTKFISSSLLIESFRPVVKSKDTFKPVALTNVKSTNHVPPVEEMCPHDPRQKINLLLKSNNGTKLNQISFHTNSEVKTTVPVVQNYGLKSNLSPMPMVISSPTLSPPLPIVDPTSLFPPPLLLPVPPMVNNLSHPFSQDKTSHCTGNTIFSQHKLSHSELPGYNISAKPINFHSSSMPVSNNSCPSTPNQYKQNHNEVNYDSSCVGRNQNPYSYQPYVNVSHSNETQYHQLDSNNRQYNRFRVRDPRLARNKPSEPYYPNYREYRLAMQSRDKNLNRWSASEVSEPSCYHSHTLEKDNLRSMEKTKSDINNKDFNNVETVVNDKARNIKDFKIPKLKQRDEVCDKHKEFKIDEISDNTDKYRKSEALKNNPVDKYRKSETIKDKTKKNELIKDSCKKNCRETEITKDRLNKEKCIMTDVTKNDKSEVRKSSSNNDKLKDLRIEITKKDLEVEGSSNNIVTKVNSTETKLSKKLKKFKKCSNEREYKKIIKEAVANSKDGDVHGPKTRSFVIKKDRKFTKNDSDATKQNPVLQENYESSSNRIDDCQNTKNNVSKTQEASQNVFVSSTSKVLSDADCSTEVVCSKRHEEKVIDVKKKKKKQKLKKIINTMKNQPGSNKVLLDLLEGVIDSDVSESSEKSDDEEQQMIKTKNKDSSGEKSFVNENINDLVSCSLDKVNLNNGCAEEVKSCTNNTIDNALNSDCSSECLSGQVKSTSNNGENHQPYKNNAILKDKSKVELKDLKIVITKLNEESNNVTGNICSPNNQPALVSSQNQPNKITQSVVSISGFETTASTISKPKCKQIITKISSKSVKCNKSWVPLRPIELPSIESDKINNTEVSKELPSTNQNVTETAETETNVSIKSKTAKKPRAKELDKLHAYNSEMSGRNAIINVPNVRHCRTKKQIGYVDTGVVIQRKSNKIVESDFVCGHPSKNVDQNIEKPKSKKKTSKHSKLSRFKLNTNRSLTHNAETTTVLKKSINVLLPSQKNKSKSLKKKKNTRNKAQFNIVLDNVMASEMSPKILSKIDFTDKSYFQSRNILLECKFCHYSSTAINVVRHYKEKHCEEEVLLSRLSKDCAENLIKESLEKNFGFLNPQDLKSIICRAPANDLFTCVFCECTIYDIVLYFDHLTTHTGEYRYKCKICEQVYSCENELENHILEHSDYDKTDGISLLLYKNPNKKVIGYLCPFCYYVQIKYDNVVKHMEMRHIDEDKKHNGNWTIVCVSLSLVNDESYKNSSIDYENLVGCLPPTLPPVDKICLSQMGKNVNIKLNCDDAKHLLCDKPPHDNVMRDLSIKQVGSSK